MSELNASLELKPSPPVPRQYKSLHPGRLIPTASTFAPVPNYGGEAISLPLVGVNKKGFASGKLVYDPQQRKRLFDQLPLNAKIRRNATLPRLEQKEDPLVGLKADTDFVQANKTDFQTALKRLGSINRLRTSVKTAVLTQSYTTTHKKGELPEFYLENKLQLQREKENQAAQAEQQRLYNENK